MLPSTFSATYLPAHHLARQRPSLPQAPSSSSLPIIPCFLSVTPMFSAIPRSLLCLPVPISLIIGSFSTSHHHIVELTGSLPQSFQYCHSSSTLCMYLSMNTVYLYIQFYDIAQVNQLSSSTLFLLTPLSLRVLRVLRDVTNAVPDAMLTAVVFMKLSFTTRALFFFL